MVRSAPAVIASTRSRRPNKEQPATEPAAVATAKEGVSAAIKHLCETDHAGSVEHPAGFGAIPLSRAFSFNDIEGAHYGAWPLGHSNLSTTARYTQVATSTIHGTVSPLDRLGPPPPS